MSGKEGKWEPSRKKSGLGEESPSLTPPVTLARATFLRCPLRVRHAGGMQIAPTEPAGENGALIVCHWHTAPSKREARSPL